MNEINVSERTHDENVLRPKEISGYIGQDKVKERIMLYAAAAKKQDRVLDHVLFTGAPGLGKTTLAHIIANAMGTNISVISATTITKGSDLFNQVAFLKRGDVLFIDEIHRLRKVIAESLYMAMEDFRVDKFVDSATLKRLGNLEGTGFIVKQESSDGALLNIPLERFTMIGATTRAGLLPKPLLDRFPIKETLEFYSPEKLAEIIKQSAKKLDMKITDDAALKIGFCGRGTPRIANRLLKRIIDFVVMKDSCSINLYAVDCALKMIEIDESGLDNNDRKLLKTLIETFKGNPVGIGTLSSCINEERDTVEDVIEPYLIQSGFIAKTSRGRVATEKAYKHLVSCVF